MNIDVREYLRINPISSHELTLSNDGNDCFIWFPSNADDGFWVNTQTQIFGELYNTIFKDLIDVAADGSISFNISGISGDDGIWDITWNDVRLQPSQFSNYVRKSDFYGNDSYETYKDTFDKQIQTLEDQVDAKINELKGFSKLDYSGATELMSDNMEYPFKTPKFSIGQIWCKSDIDSVQDGQDRESVPATISHNHRNTRAESLTSSFVTSKGGTNVVGDINIGSKQMVAQSSFQIQSLTLTPKNVTNTGSLSYPLSGLNVLDWRNPDRTHNNIPPSYNIYVLYEDKEYSSRSIEIPNETVSFNDINNDFAKNKSRDNAYLISSIIEAFYESSTVESLSDYSMDNLTKNDLLLRMSLTDGQVNLYKQTIQMFLDIFIGGSEQTLGRYVESSTGQYWKTDDDTYVKDTSTLYYYDSEYDRYLKLKTGEYVLVRTHYEKVSNKQAKYEFIGIDTLLKAYFDNELVLVNEFAQWVLDKSEQLQRIQQKIDLIKEYIVGIPPIVYVGRIIISTTDDTEKKVISHYGGKSWKRVVNFLRGVELDENGSSTLYKNQIGEKFGEEWVCLRESNLPNHTHNVVNQKQETEQLNTLDDNKWVCTNKGGEDSVLVNSSGTTQKNIVNKSLEYQVSPLEVQSDTNNLITYPHNNIPPYKQVYIWECTELMPDEGEVFDRFGIYLITYDTQGLGQIPETAWRSYSIASDLPYTPPNLTATGYTFKGWTPSTLPVGAQGDFKFTANWQAIPYTITWNKQNGDENIQWIKSYGDIIKWFPASPSRQGYTFSGWYTESTGGTQVQLPITVTGNTTYYAHWERKSYTINFDNNLFDVKFDSNVSGFRITFDNNLFNIEFDNNFN